MSSYEYNPYEDTGPPNVTIAARDGAGEISVVDGRFQEVARGLGLVELNLPPGIYRARSAVGQTYREQLFSVSAESDPQHLQLDPVEFETPIPIKGTRSIKASQKAALTDAYGTPMTQLGDGGEVVVFIRDPGDDYAAFTDEQLRLYKKSFSGFALLTSDGRKTDLLENGDCRANEGRLLFRASVNTGTCVLAVPSYGGEQVCMPLVVTPGLAVQVFIMLESENGNELRRWPDVNGASVVFQPAGSGFDAGRADLRVYEAARKALASGSNNLGASGMRQLLQDKFDNPMLGLVVAHLILLRQKPNLDLLVTVLGNTEAFLEPQHPDLLALRWQVAELAGDRDQSRSLAESIARLTQPPMLQLGWRLIQDAVNKHGLRPDSGPFALAGDVISSSVWLLWSFPLRETLASVQKLNTPPEPETVEINLGGLLAGYAGHDLSAVLGNVLSSDTPFANTTRAVFIPVLKKFQDRLRGKTSAPALPVEEEESFAAESLLALAKRVDWSDILKRLKRKALESDKSLTLSTRQRHLLLALKDLYELAADDDGLTKEEIREWLTHYNVDLKGISRDLRRVLEVADRVSHSVDSAS